MGLPAVRSGNDSLKERVQPVVHHPGTQPGPKMLVLPVVKDAKLLKARRPRVPRLALRRREGQETWAQSTTSWRRPLSPLSLHEAAYTKETMSIGIYRQCIDDEMAHHDVEMAAFAMHRMDCQRQARLREREQAALWRKRREVNEPLQQVRWLLLPLVARKPVTPPAEDLPPLPDLEASSGPPSRPPSVCDVEATEERGSLSPGGRTPLNDRVLERLKSRSHNLGEEKNWRITLMRKRTQREKARKATARPMFLVQDEVNVSLLSTIQPKEAQAYQSILRQMYSNRKVDQADLQLVLVELGFRPRTAEERAAVREILSRVEQLEVDFDVVIQDLLPRIRLRYAELRGPLLIELFQAADEDSSGALSVEELMAVMQRSGFYPQMKEVEETLLEVIPGAKNHQNMEGKLLLDRVSISSAHFRVVGPLLQERAECQRLRMELQIAEELGLDSAERQLWQDSLLDLWEAFHRLAVGNLEAARLPLLLMEVELVPKQRSLRALLKDFAEAEVSKTERSDGLDLRQCIRILSKIREKECQRVVEVFHSNDVDQTNGLGLEECQKCLRECGASSEEDSDFLASLIEEYDLDESGELELEEFTRMVKFVVPRLRRRRVRGQADVALAHGWGQEEFEFIRLKFMEADQHLDGRIRDEEIAWALEQLRAEWPGDDTTAILREMQLSTWNSSVTVDLVGFLAVLSYVDHRLRHRQIGSILGLEKEAVENFCSVWWSMNPQNDTVAITSLVDVLHQLPGYNRKLAKLQEVINEGAERINFQKYCLVMRRSQRGHEQRSKSKLEVEET